MNYKDCINRWEESRIAISSYHNTIISNEAEKHLRLWLYDSLFWINYYNYYLYNNLYNWAFDEANLVLEIDRLLGEQFQELFNNDLIKFPIDYKEVSVHFVMNELGKKSIKPSKGYFDWLIGSKQKRYKKQINFLLNKYKEEILISYQPFN
jgi:hypothetical protein